MSKNFSVRTMNVVVVIILAIGLVGCSDGGDGTTDTTAEQTSLSSASSTTTEATSTSTESTTTTTQSTTSNSTATEDAVIVIDYLCEDGDTGSAEFSTDDIEELNQFLDVIDLCEFKGGLTEISFTAPCPSGDREVTLAANDGTIPPIDSLDLCENP